MRCKPQTRDRILRVAKQLNYRPNTSARYLKTKNHYALGFLTHDITDVFVVECIGAIEEVLSRMNYRALWVSAKLYPSSDQLLTTIRSLPIDGLMILAADQLISDPEILMLHARDQLRAVTLIRKVAGGHISSVTVDNALGIRLLMEHLIQLGHREFGFLPDVMMHDGAVARFEAFKSILVERNLPIRPEWWQATVGSVQEGFKAATRILSCPRLPTAIIAFNDLAAFGCIRACRERGLVVPSDISVAGFDDIGMAANYNPGLTTVSTEFGDLAKAAVNQMFSSFEADSAPFQAEHIVIKPKLSIRKSTAIPAFVSSK